MKSDQNQKKKKKQDNALMFVIRWYIEGVSSEKVTKVHIITEPPTDAGRRQHLTRQQKGPLVSKDQDTLWDDASKIQMSKEIENRNDHVFLFNLIWFPGFMFKMKWN